MPIYEYKCRQCSHEFEKLIRSSSDLPECPQCATVDVEKKLSLGAGISTTKSRNRVLGIARAKGKAIKKEQDHAQREYERNYIKDHS